MSDCAHMDLSRYLLINSEFLQLRTINERLLLFTSELPWYELLVSIVVLDAKTCTGCLGEHHSHVYLYMQIKRETSFAITSCLHDFTLLLNVILRIDQLLNLGTEFSLLHLTPIVLNILHCTHFSDGIATEKVDKVELMFFDG